MQSTAANNNKAYPGKLLGSFQDYVSGPGTYVYLNQIHASKKGTVEVIKSTKLGE